MRGRKGAPELTQITEYEVVGAARFELTTSASQTRRSTRLSYAPVHGGTLVDSRGRIKKFLHKNFNYPDSKISIAETP